MEGDELAADSDDERVERAEAGALDYHVQLAAGLLGGTEPDRESAACFDSLHIAKQEPSVSPPYLIATTGVPKRVRSPSNSYTLGIERSDVGELLETGVIRSYRLAATGS